MSGKLVTAQERDQEMIAEECDGLKSLLLAKNKAYGSSALEPVRIFSKATPIEQILVRIDDKLSRIKTTGFEAADEDTLQDLVGYLMLLRVARRRARTSVRLEDIVASMQSDLRGAP